MLRTTEMKKAETLKNQQQNIGEEKHHPGAKSKFNGSQDAALSKG